MYNDPRTGKRKRRSTRCTNKAQAIREVKKFIDGLDATPLGEAEIPFGEYAAPFFLNGSCPRQMRLYDNREPFDAFFPLLAIGAIVGGDAPADESPSSDAIADTSEWYEGGTLHQATMAEWRDATYENKLATAADFLAATVWEGSLNTPSDFSAMHEDAVAVVVGLDESIRGTDVADNTRVSEMAGMLFMLIPDLGPDR